MKKYVLVLFVLVWACSLNAQDTIVRGRGDKPLANPYKNFVALTVTDIPFGVLTASFLRNIYKDRLVLRMPVSTGTSTLMNNYVYNTYGSGYYTRNKIFMTGVELLAFPSGQQKRSYYVGLTSEFGTYAHVFFNHFDEEFRQTDSYYAFGLKNGLQLLRRNGACISTYITVGIVTKDRDYELMGRFGVDLGWRF